MRYVCKNPPGGGGGTKPLSAHRLYVSLCFALDTKIRLIFYIKNSIFLYQEIIFNSKFVI